MRRVFESFEHEAETMTSVYLCYVVSTMVNDYIQTFFSEKRMNTLKGFKSTAGRMFVGGRGRGQEGWQKEAATL